MQGSRSHQVLVLEDSILVAMAIEAALEDRGFEAIVVGSLAAAQERLNGVAPCSGADADAVPDGHGFAQRFTKPIAAEALASWVAGLTGQDRPDPAP